jgi:NADPH2:quinone reductase
MKRWRVYEHGEPEVVLQLEQADEFSIGAGEYRVKVHAAGVGLPDVLMCRKQYPLTPPLPFTPGQEVVGEVLEAGTDTRFAVGQRIVGITDFLSGRGGFAEQCVIPEYSAYPAAASLSDVDAASFTSAFHTAWVGLKIRTGLQSGDVLLVHGGAGGTGAAAILVGKALGARVIATAGGEIKCDWCRTLGADLVIDYRSENFVDKVREFSDGGADVVFDPVGSDTFERSFDCMALQGRILPIGFAAGRWGEVPMGKILGRNLTVVGAMPTGFPRQDMLAWHQQLLDLMAQAEAPSLVTARYSFDDIPQALISLAGRGAMGRVVIEMPV